MAYCTSQDVNNLFGDISDDITEEMFETVITNSTSWINSNLRKRFTVHQTFFYHYIMGKNCQRIMTSGSRKHRTY